MLDQAVQGQFASHLDNAQTVVVILSAQAKRDAVAAATALTQSLVQHGKVVRLVAPKPKELQEHTGLTHLESIQNELGNQNLTISFPYVPEQVDKVSYHIGEETQRFYLTVKPKSGTDPINYSEVEFAYTGTTADVFITVGVNNLEDLDQLYYGYEDTYKDTSVLSLHTHTVSFAALSVDAGSMSSISEATAQLLFALELPVDMDAATNLLSGIETATRHFTSYAATAETFEVVSKLLRAGARRVRVEEDDKAVQSQKGAPKPKENGQVIVEEVKPATKTNAPQVKDEAEKKSNGKSKRASLPKEFTPGKPSRA